MVLMTLLLKYYSTLFITGAPVKPLLRSIRPIAPKARFQRGKILDNFLDSTGFVRYNSPPAKTMGKMGEFFSKGICFNIGYPTCPGIFHISFLFHILDSEAACEK